MVVRRGAGWMAGFGFASAVAWLVVSVGDAGLARAMQDEGRRPAPVAQAYQAGPLEARDFDAIPALPAGARELLGLSLLVAVVYGLRASGLTRSSNHS